MVNQLNPSAHTIIARNDHILTDKVEVSNTHLKNISDISTSSKKTFTEGTDPSEPLGSGETSDKIFSINGGVDNSSGSFSELNPIRVDSSGTSYTSVVNTVNIAPANSLNSHITDDPANSIAVGLTGRTTIGTATSQKHLLCDSQGHLQVDVLNQDRSAHLEAFTDITDTGTVKRLLCDNQGHLQVDISELKSQTKTINQYASQSLTGNGEWATITDTTGYGKLSIVINSDATTNLMLYGSSTSGGTYLPFKTILITSEDTGSSTHNIGFVEVESPPDFIKIVNVDASGVVLEIIMTLSN